MFAVDSAVTPWRNDCSLTHFPAFGLLRGSRTTSCSSRETETSDVLDAASHCFTAWRTKRVLPRIRPLRLDSERYLASEKMVPRSAFSTLEAPDDRYLGGTTGTADVVAPLRDRL